MKIVVFLLLIFFVQPMVFAGKYFDFSGQNPILDVNGEVVLDISYDLVGVGEDKFRIRPIDGYASVCIWDETGEKWVSGLSYWTELPHLSKKVKLSFPNPDFDAVEMYFQIQDTKTAVIYETPKHEIWSRNWFIRYVQKLNEQVFEVVEYSSEDY